MSQDPWLLRLKERYAEQAEERAEKRDVQQLAKQQAKQNAWDAYNSALNAEYAEYKYACDLLKSSTSSRLYHFQLSTNINNYSDYRQKIIQDTYDQTMDAINAVSMECD